MSMCVSDWLFLGMSTVSVNYSNIGLDLFLTSGLRTSQKGSCHGVMCLPPHGHIVSQVFLKRNLIGLEFKCRQIYFLFLFSKEQKWIGKKLNCERWQAERLKLNIWKLNLQMSCHPMHAKRPGAPCLHLHPEGPKLFMTVNISWH